MKSNLQIYKNDIEANLKNIKKYKLDILILQRQNETICQKNNEEIERATNQIIELEQEIKINLKGSGEKKIETSAGWCSFRVMPDKWEYDEEKILLWCKDFKMPYYYTKEILRKLELKNDIKLEKIKSEEVPGITITNQAPKFNYKLNGGM